MCLHKCASVAFLLACRTTEIPLGPLPQAAGIGGGDSPSSSEDSLSSEVVWGFDSNWAGGSGMLRRFISPRF
jgi:hypothetical protein